MVVEAIWSWFGAGEGQCGAEEQVQRDIQGCLREEM